MKPSLWINPARHLHRSWRYVAIKSAMIIGIHCLDWHARVRNSLKILSGLGQIVKESFVNLEALVIFVYLWLICSAKTVVSSWRQEHSIQFLLGTLILKPCKMLTYRCCLGLFLKGALHLLQFTWNLTTACESLYNEGGIVLTKAKGNEIDGFSETVLPMSIVVGNLFPR